MVYWLVGLYRLYRYTGLAVLSFASSLSFLTIVIIIKTSIFSLHIPFSMQNTDYKSCKTTEHAYMVIAMWNFRHSWNIIKSILWFPNAIEMKYSHPLMFNNPATSPSDRFLSGTDFPSTVLLAFHISVIWQFTFWHWHWFVGTNLQKTYKISLIYLTILKKNTGFHRSSNLL